METFFYCFHKAVEHKVESQVSQFVFLIRDISSTRFMYSTGTSLFAYTFCLIILHFLLGCHYDALLLQVGTYFLFHVMGTTSI
jgi:hypothetical protein